MSYASAETGGRLTVEGVRRGYMIEEDNDGDEFETPDLDEVLEKNQSADELAETDPRPLIPEGVLRGIEDLAQRRTAGFSEIRDALDY